MNLTRQKQLRASQPLLFWLWVAELITLAIPLIFFGGLALLVVLNLIFASSTSDGGTGLAGVALVFVFGPMIIGVVLGLILFFGILLLKKWVLPLMVLSTLGSLGFLFSKVLTDNYLMQIIGGFLLSVAMIFVYRLMLKYSEPVSPSSPSYPVATPDPTLHIPSS